MVIESGDKCLIKVADTLARGVRKNDRVCRIGGGKSFVLSCLIQIKTKLYLWQKGFVGK